MFKLVMLYCLTSCHMGDIAGPYDNMELCVEAAETAKAYMTIKNIRGSATWYCRKVKDVEKANQGEYNAKSMISAYDHQLVATIGSIVIRHVDLGIDQ